VGTEGRGGKAEKRSAGATGPDPGGRATG